MLRLARLADDWAPRPVDARWQVAVAIAQGEVTRRFFREVMDRDTDSALRYARKCSPTVMPAPGPMRDIHLARFLRYSADRLTRATLEARLLAGQPIAETAAACTLPVEVVRLYESLFFAVRDKLKHPIYILNNAVGPQYFSGYTEDDFDIILKFLAYRKGPLFLDYILPYYTTAWRIPSSLVGLANAELTNLQKMTEIRAMITALVMSPREALTAYPRYLAGEPANQWDGLARELRALIDTPAEHVDLAPLTTMAPTVMDRLIDTFVPAPAVTPSDSTPEPVRLAS
jgi:hypothetical protein